MGRISERLGTLVGALFHVGRQVRCPVCGWEFRRFQTYRTENEDTARACWRCGSEERHRAIWLYLDHRPELLGHVWSLLHFAPERSLRRRLQSVAQIAYTSADMQPGRADLTIDMTDMDLPDASYDAMICSHVLEHVSDDRQAMAEVGRVLAPGGWAMIMVPIDYTRERTYEDPAITDPEDRRRAFWQHDHLRLYGRDVSQRLQESGLAVETFCVGDEFDTAACERYGLFDDHLIFICRKAAR